MKTVHNCRFSPPAPNPRRQHKNLQKYSKLKSISHIELCIHIGIYNIVLLVYLNYKMGDFWWYVYVKNIYNSIKLCAKNGTTPFNANLCNPNLHANLHTNINVCTSCNYRILAQIKMLITFILLISVQYNVSSLIMIIKKYVHIWKLHIWFALRN